MIAKAIQTLIDLSNGSILEKFGRAYTKGTLTALPSPAALPDTIACVTLQSFVDYTTKLLARDLPQEAAQAAIPTADGAVFVNVEGPAKVSLVSFLAGDFKQRLEYATAEPYLPERTFPFGKYIGIEDFVTELQARFVRDEEVAKILLVVGNITDNKVKTLEDDGTTQAVAVRVGLGKIAAVDLPNPVLLKPFRTFPEVGQPAVRFVLRMRPGGDGALPTAALFEVDDGGWRLDAVQAVKSWLQAHEIGVPVLA